MSAVVDGTAVDERIAMNLGYRRRYAENRQRRLVDLYTRAVDECVRRETEGTKVSVEFSVTYETTPGQDIFLVGTGPLGEWQPESAIPMKWTPGAVWKAVVELPADSQLEYKFIVKLNHGIMWEQGANHVLKAQTLVKEKKGESIPLPSSWNL
mmetsp:Transcript_65761/g.157153  ORF Transcript_65761/g.157153 Transcript_65761/m.157153 type:complete len:153 (-) Transcript_65761:205-663(-)